MSKLQEIENKLLNINDAVFQNVCDAILFVLDHNYENINRTGSQKGKQKTIKGTPDAYFTYPNGRYVFIEYTTKSKGSNRAVFLQKIKDDLDKCLDDRKTGISVANIAKIVYCHNSTLLLNETEEVTEYCRKYGVKLELKGIDDIALLLLGRAAYAAKLFLGISIDTAQIIPVKQFIKEYEASGFATVLSNQFLGRESEVAQLLDLINNNLITIVKGQPGTGKSKLVLNCLSHFQQTNPHYQVFCISNKNAPIFDDLRLYINHEDNFLLFIDDANRQINNLRTLLPILREQRAGYIKVIITVREYAYPEIYNVCRDFFPAEMEVPKLQDEQITTIIKSSDFNIQNNLFVNRILEIAEGNPRLAIMAAKVAIESQNILKLHDPSEIYDEYFKNAIPDHQLFDNYKLMKTLGVISFFHAIDLTNNEFLSKLLALINLDQYTFRESVEYLERLELLETSADYTIVKINDQVLATFFFYKVFFKNKVLDFGAILENYFANYTSRVRDSILPANNTFGHKKVLEQITPALSTFWNSCKSNSEIAIKFLQTFWFYRDDDVFSYVWDYIENLPDGIQEYTFVENSQTPASRDLDIYLDLLSNFYQYNLPQTFTAVELGFEYVKKRPRFFTYFLKSIIEKFGFSHEDQLSGFKRQKKIFKLLYENFEIILYREAFYVLGGKFLLMNYRVHTSSRKKNTISWYQYKLQPVPSIITFRKKIWKRVASNFRKFPEKTVTFIDRYLTMSPDWVKEIAVTDLPCLLLLYKKFTPKNFIHCYLVQENIWWFNLINVVDENLIALKSRFTNETYKEYRLVTMDRLRDQSEYDFEDYTEYARLKDEELRTSKTFKNLTEFKKFYQRFLLILRWSSSRKRNVNYNETIDVILQANFEINPKLGWQIVKYIIKEGNTADLYLWRIIKSVQDIDNPRGLIDFYNLLMDNTFLRKSSWVILYFDFLPEKHVDIKRLDQFISYLKHNEEPYLNLYFENFKKFLKIDPNSFVEILRIINQNIENKKVKWSIDYHEFVKNLESFSIDLKILQKAYLLQDSLQDYFDFNCDLLFLLIERNSGFLNDYIEFLTKDRFFISSRDYPHLNRIWSFINAEKLLEDAIVLIAAKALIPDEHSFINTFFENLAEPTCTRALKFLKNTITKFANNTSVLTTSINIILTCFKPHKKEFIKHLLTVNNSYVLFTEIEWIETSYTGTPDTNFDAIRASGWQSILDILNEIKKSAYKYSKHKAFVINQISYYNMRAQEENRSRFMTDRY